MKSKLLAAMTAALVVGAANASTEQFLYAVSSDLYSGLLNISESNGVGSASLWIFGFPTSGFYFADPSPSNNDYHQSGTIDLQIVDGQLDKFHIDYHICTDDTCHFARAWFMDGDSSSGTIQFFDQKYDNSFEGFMTPTIPEPANIGLMLAGLGIVVAAARRSKAQGDVGMTRAEPYCKSLADSSSAAWRATPH